MSAYPIYYLREGSGSQPQLWKTEEFGTWPLQPWHSKNPFPTTPEISIWDINSESGWAKEQFVRPILPPGRYFPRMARPIVFENSFGCPLTDEDEIFLSEAIGQLNIFCRDLDLICRTIHPVPANMASYGHDTRNLLILACMEVESYWKGVIRLNGGDGRTTNDYIKLLRPMKLDQYEVQFLNYKWLGTFSPFRGWSVAGGATKSLPWYNAYNGVKHDRELEFSNAHLANVFNSIAACVVLLLAQFGPLGLGYAGDRRTDPLNYFSVTKYPEWHLHETYISYFESPSSEFVPENFHF